MHEGGKAEFEINLIQSIFPIFLFYVTLGKVLIFLNKVDEEHFY